MWKPDDWHRYTLDYLMCAYRGYRRNMDEHWDIARTISFYSVVSFNGTKKIKRPTDLFRLPHDKKQSMPDQPTKFTKMKSREEIYETYKKNGLELEEWQLDKMIK